MSLYCTSCVSYLHTCMYLISWIRYCISSFSCKLVNNTKKYQHSYCTVGNSKYYWHPEIVSQRHPWNWIVHRDRTQFGYVLVWFWGVHCSWILCCSYHAYCANFVLSKSQLSEMFGFENAKTKTYKATSDHFQMSQTIYACILTVYVYVTNNTVCNLHVHMYSIYTKPVNIHFYTFWLATHYY